ncbi:MAG: ferredoxin [Ilumatobacteraceae bacterium]
MRVWIDQDLCTGDGLCVDRSPDVFTLLEDGIAYVVENGLPQNDPGGSRSLAFVEKREEAAVVEAAEICPGECIFIEMDDKNLSPIGSGSRADYSHSSG